MILTDERIREIATKTARAIVALGSDHEVRVNLVSEAIRQALSEAQLTESTVDKGEG